MNNYDDNASRSFELAMEECNRLISDSEEYLHNHFVETDVPDTDEEELSPPDEDEVSPTDEDGVSRTDDDGVSRTDEVGVSPTNEDESPPAPNLIANDSEIEILDCTTFPMPRTEEDDVQFVSIQPAQRNPRNRAHMRRLLNRWISNFTHPDPGCGIDLTSKDSPPQSRSVPSTSSISSAVSSPSTSWGFMHQRKRKSDDTAVIAKKKPDLEDTTPDIGFKCLVCYEIISNSLEPVSTKCGHLFCKECLTKCINIKKKCPVCQKTLNHKSYHRIYV